jgi:hypothetical protein
MPSLITQDVKASSRKKLIALTKVNALRQRTADKKEAKALAKKIGAVHAPFRLAFRKELEKHPGGKMVRKECDNAIKAIQTLAKRRPKSEQQRSEIEKELESIRKTLDSIDKEHGVMLSEATQRTIKRSAYLGAIFKAFEKRGRIEFEERRYGALAMKFTPYWSDLLGRWEAFSPHTSFVFEPPYDVEAAVTEHFSALAGFNSTRADASDGLLIADAMTLIGGYQMARAQHGAFLTVPAGFSTIKLRARIANISATVTASAIGASWASSGGIAEVTSLANNAVTRRETSINYVVAPIIFYAQDQFDGPHTINAEFDISNEGDEILVTAGLKADCWAVAAGGAFAFTIDHVAKITVELS